MSNILFLDKPQVQSGLQTCVHTAKNGGLYSVQVQLTEVPVTGLSLTVVNTTTSTTILTAPTISPTQIAQQFKVGFQAAANDVITITMSSTTPVDLVANNVKWTCTIQNGL